MKLYIFIVGIFFFSACHNGSGFQTKTDTTIVMSMEDVGLKDKDAASVHQSRFSNPALESRITDTLMTLSFVRESHRYIDSFSNHTHGMAFIVDSSEDGIDVMAGYNDPERFDTYYHFNIDPVSFEIKILDVLEDELIPVQEYIKNLRNKSIK